MSCEYYLEENCFYGDRRAAAKKYGKSGQTFRKNVHRRKDFSDGTFWFSDTVLIRMRQRNHNANAPCSFEENVLPENRNRSKFANAVEYSIRKHKRWEWIEELQKKDEMIVHVDSRRKVHPLYEKRIKAVRPTRFKVDKNTPKKTIFIKKNRKGTNIYHKVCKKKKLKKKCLIYKPNSAHLVKKFHFNRQCNILLVGHLNTCLCGYRKCKHAPT